MGKKIVQVVLDLINASYNRKMKESSQVTGSFTKNAKQGMSSMVAAWGKVAVAVGAVYGVYKLILKPAMDAEESASKFAPIFGPQANQVTEWANRTGAAMNRSSREMQGMAADVMALISPMAATREAAINMSQGAVQAAQDLASFHNTDVTDALGAIRSGLTGETEPLKRFGILLTDAAMQEYAFAQGIRKKIADMTTAEKTQLRYNMILAKMGAASGDATRTAGSLTNTLRGIQATLGDNAVELGSRMVPGLTKLAQAFKMSLDRGGPLTDILNKMAEGVNAVAEAIGDNMIEGMRFDDVANEIANIREVTYSAIDAYSGMQDEESALIETTIRAAGAERSRYNQLKLLIAEYQKRLDEGSIQNGQRIEQVTRRMAELREELQRLPQPIQTATQAMTFSITQVLNGITQAQTQANQATNNAAAAAQQAAAKWRQLRDNMMSMWAGLSQYAGQATAAELAQEEDKYTKLRAQLGEYLAFRLMSQAEYNAAIEAAEQAHQDNVQGIRDMEVVRESERRQKAAADQEKLVRARLGMESVYYQGLNAMASMGANLMQSKNKHLFRIGQALAISNSIMNAAEAVMAGMKYGPFIGPAYAALVAANLAVSIGRIKAQKPPEMAVGTWQVPQDMTATIHRGEQIIPRPMADAVRAGDAALVGGGAGGGGDRTIVLQIDGRTIGEITDGYRAQNARNMGTRDYMTKSVYR